MKENESIQSKSAIRKGIKQYVPFFLCLAISAILWFTREMGKSYEEEITLNVAYENVPKSLALISEVPSTLRVSVEGTGWGILSHYLFDDETVTLDVTEIEGSNISKLSTKDHRIMNVLNENLKVLDVYPDDISFYFEKINAKKVPVKTDISLSFEQQYALDGEVSITPDSIYVYGSKVMTDTITKVFAETVELKKLKESFKLSVPIRTIDNLRLSADSVCISGIVEKFTEQTIAVPIKLMNAPDIAVDLMNDKVTLTFIIGISKVQAYNPSDFEAIADFEKMSEKGLVPVEIVRQPEFVHIVHQEPVNDAIITNYTEE